MLRGCVGSGDVGDWVGVGVGVMTLFRLNVPVPRSVFGTFVVGLPWSSLICWVGFVGMYVRGWMPLLVSRCWLQEDGGLALNRGSSRPGVAETLLFNNVRTMAVRLRPL